MGIYNYCSWSYSRHKYGEIHHSDEIEFIFHTLTSTGFFE